jgi:predicted Holliday junction resolvase-like endonuclease
MQSPSDGMLNQFISSWNLYFNGAPHTVDFIDFNGETAENISHNIFIDLRRSARSPISKRENLIDQSHHTHR